MAYLFVVELDRYLDDTLRSCPANFCLASPLLTSICEVVLAWSGPDDSY